MPSIKGEPHFLSRIFPFLDPDRSTPDEIQKRRWGREAHRRAHGRATNDDVLPADIVAKVAAEHQKEPPHDLGEEMSFDREAPVGRRWH